MLSFGLDCIIDGYDDDDNYHKSVICMEFLQMRMVDKDVGLFII
jgi:hypothetical protein